MIRGLSFDPGQQNFAYCVSDHRVNEVMYRQESRVEECGHLRHTITSLNASSDLLGQIELFETELDYLFDEFGPFDFIVAERFMGRAALVGTMGETVNMMLGILIAYTRRIGAPFPVFVNAGVWKGEYARRIGSFSEGLNADYKLCRASPHQLDAALIGAYRAGQIMGLGTFQMLYDESRRDRFWQHVESASVEPLVNRRYVRNYYSESSV